MTITTGKAAEITGGKLYGPAGMTITDLLTDSRHPQTGEGSAFFAINGKNHDGHRFIEQMYRRGVRIFFAEKLPYGHDNFHDSAFIINSNTIDALQAVAAEKRKQFTGQVFAVTGSAGKTVVKEWLADILGSVIPVVRSPKSYNSQVGVPLSVWKMENNFKAAIIEAGISQPGEMEKLRRIIDPDIGIITNIGDAHSENFSGFHEKSAEKLKLFTGSRVIVYCRDQEVIRHAILSDPLLKSKKLFDWSFSDGNASVFVKRIKETESATEIVLTFHGGSFTASVPFRDRASVDNAVTAAVACLAAGVSPADVSKAISGLASVAMRMEIKAGVNGSLLIEDYYNSDPGSLRMALEYLKSYDNRRSVLILSDFLQTGRDEKDLYREVAGLVRLLNIDRFIGIGAGLSRNREFFPNDSAFYESTHAFCRDADSHNFSGEVILLKGAREYEFERISSLLSQKIHQTVLRINLDVISHNINEIRKHISSGTKIMAMVKAFAYGAGPSGIASLMEFQRIDYLAVACADEGVELREAGSSLPVMVMNPEPDAFDMMIRYNLEPEIYSINLLRRFAVAAERHGLADYPVHIKIDTGMHRLGFMPDETRTLACEISASGTLKIASVFSHLAASEDPAYDSFTRKQAAILTEMADRIRQSAGYNFYVHLLNTAGIIRFPEYQFDMVRPGIGIYGIAGVGGINLRQAGRFVTRISQVKNVPPGEPVGYGCADISEKERRVAILPAGYADGLNRRMGNGRGRLFIKNSYVPLVGNICMDMCMADITGTDAGEGDEAEIFGENISVEEVAEITGTIPYEILTSLPPRVKRVFIRE